jgi:hypothetical protein
MAELGSVLPQLIYAIANPLDGRGPFLFSKLDIKDGYWRMVVPEDEEWHFAYILPKESPDEDTYLVIPSSLQMGWCDSPAFFCAASETARNVTEDLAAKPLGSLPKHPLEGMLLHPAQWPNGSIERHATKFLHLVEVYVDDFIQLAQTTDPEQLEHLSCAILHGIHSVFPPRWSLAMQQGKTQSPSKSFNKGTDYGQRARSCLDGCLMEPKDALNCLPTKS